MLVSTEQSLEMKYDIAIDQTNQVAYIEFDLASLPFPVERILDENGVELTLDQPFYEVQADGEYQFTITYLQDMEQHVFEQRVTVAKLALKAEKAQKLGRDLVPDENFYKYLVREHGLAEDFTVDDLKTIQEIRYTTSDSKFRISDLTGIAYMSELTHIYLNDQNVHTLAPMESAVYPKLQMIEFNNWNTGTNQVHDFSLLTKTRFPSLNRQVMFNNNGISDLDLATLPSTGGIEQAKFHFQNNQISSLEPFMYYPDLQELHLQHNQIVDLTPLSNFQNIKVLQLSNNNIADISALSTLTSTEDVVFYLNNNNIHDLSPLQSFEGTVYAQTYSESVDPYYNPDENVGQRVTLTTPIYGDRKTKTIQLYATCINRDGTLIPIRLGNSLVYEQSIPLSDMATSYTYTAYSSTFATRYLGTITQPIVWWDDPTLETPVLEFYAGDSFDLMDGIRAYDSAGTSLENSVVILQQDTLNAKVPGTYEVEYQVIDERGYEATQTRVVKVHGKPTLNVENKRFNLEDISMDKVLLPVEASWLEAQDTVGEPAKKVKIAATDIDCKIVSGPSTKFDAVGIYNLQYSATNGVQTVSADANVLLNAKNSVQDILTNVVIGADHVQLDYEEAIQLKAADVMALANVSAYKINKFENGDIKSFVDAHTYINVDNEQLNALKSNPEGGVYKLLFDVQVDGFTVSKEIFVVVYGEHTKKDEGTTNAESLVITAKDFAISALEGKVLTQEQAIELAQVQALLLEKEQFITNVVCDEQQLLTIKQAKAGVYPLTFVATYNSSENKTQQMQTTIQVFISNQEAVSDTGQQIQKASIVNGSVETGDKSAFMFYLCLTFLSILGIVKIKKYNFFRK